MMKRNYPKKPSFDRLRIGQKLTIMVGQKKVINEVTVGFLRRGAKKGKTVDEIGFSEHENWPIDYNYIEFPIRKRKASKL